MDHHQPKPRGKILKLLSKAVTFHHHPPITPGRDTRQPDHNPTKLFSGPLKISMIPVQARTKPKNSSFETQEPTSPKVSCIGQIKQRKKINERSKRNGSDEPHAGAGERNRPSAIQRLFSGVKLGKMKSEAAGVLSDRRRRHEKPPVPERAPAVSQMKRFSSGRGALANFDWTAQIAPVDGDGDEVVTGCGVKWVEEEVGPLQPRKEVNLWKRRTMVPPTPLQLNAT